MEKKHIKLHVRVFIVTLYIFKFMHLAAREESSEHNPFIKCLIVHLVHYTWREEFLLTL